jgi:hypothetical protein
MELVVEMSLGAIVYILSFLKTGSGIQKLMWGIYEICRKEDGGIWGNYMKFHVYYKEWFKKSFTTLRAYTYLLRGYEQYFELS